MLAQANKPLGKGQILELVRARMEGQELAKKIGELGIDFEPTDEYLEALQKAGAPAEVVEAVRDARPQPLTREQVLQLLAGGVPSSRTATLVQQRGIDFEIDDDYLQTLRVAGGDDEMIAAVRAASTAARAELRVETSPGAAVYLDDQLQGESDAQGHLTMSKVKLGAHRLKVSRSGKRDFVQNITVARGVVNELTAPLADLPGRILVDSSPGAQVFLDDMSRGQTDAAGKFLIEDVPAGSHRVGVTAPDKQEVSRQFTLLAGEEIRVEAELADRESPGGGKWAVSTQESADYNALKNELDVDKKIRLAEAYVEKYPRSNLVSYAYAFEASAFQDKGDAARTVEYAEKSLGLKKDNLVSLLTMSYIIPTPQYLHLHPGDERNQLNTAEAYCRDAMRAIDALEKEANEQDLTFVRRKAGYTSNVHADLGMIHLQRAELGSGGLDKNELASAEMEFNLAVSGTDQPDPNAYYRLGEACRLQGKADEAIAAFTKASELGSGVVKQYAQQQVQALKRQERH